MNTALIAVIVRVLDTLSSVVDRLVPPKPVGVFLGITFGPFGEPSERKPPVSSNITVASNVTSFDASINPMWVNPNNPADTRPGQIDGAPTWEIVNAVPPGVASITTDPTDPKQAHILLGGVEGTFTVKVSADADLGAGVKTVESTGDFTVVAPRVNDLGLGFSGIPIDRPTVVG